MNIKKVLKGIFIADVLLAIYCITYSYVIETGHRTFAHMFNGYFAYLGYLFLVACYLKGLYETKVAWALKYLGVMIIVFFMGFFWHYPHNFQSFIYKITELIACVIILYMNEPNIKNYILTYTKEKMLNFMLNNLAILSGIALFYLI